MTTPELPVLIDVRAHNGSRQFLALPQTRDWFAVRDYVEFLPGALLTGFVSDNVTEAWIDFTFSGHSFAINDQFGEYWFFVRKPACPEEVLRLIGNHFAKLLICRETA